MTNPIESAKEKLNELAEKKPQTSGILADLEKSDRRQTEFANGKNPRSFKK